MAGNRSSANVKPIFQTNNILALDNISNSPSHYLIDHNHLLLMFSRLSFRMPYEMSGYTHIDDGSVVVGAGPFYRSGGVAIPDGKQHLVSPTKGVDGKARSGCLFCTVLGL